MKAFEVLIVGLAVPGLIPALAVARRSPAVIFLAPLIGALMAAIAAEFELGVGGSLLRCYVLVSIAVNVAVVGWLLTAWWLRRRAGPLATGIAAAGRSRPQLPWTWGVLAVLVVVAVLLIPLSGLRARVVGWDANSIWLTHALMLSGGHRELLSSLRDPTYLFSNPDYPPLVPAAGALAFAFFGQSDLYLAINMTELVAACGLGLVGTGIASVAASGRRLTRIPAIAAGGAICLVGFAVAGVPGISGYADLPWSAAAVAAIIFGLVLPVGTQNLLIAWICAAAASLTKNEGLTTAIAVIILIALRYRPVSLSWLRRVRHGLEFSAAAARLTARAWAERAALVVVPALPGLIWAGQIHLIGLRDAFFKSHSAESAAYRAGATVEGMAHYLGVAPVALGVLIVGCIFLRRNRAHAGLGNPAWLWTACLLGLGVIFTTYVVGTLQIHVWLRTSIGRTTVFAQLLLYADLAIWLVIAVDAAFAREGGRQRATSPAPGPIADQQQHEGDAGSRDRWPAFPLAGAASTEASRTAAASQLARAPARQLSLLPRRP